MCGTYEVKQSGKVVGNVVISREGLYYRIFCKSDLSGEVMFRLIMQQEEKELDLGILTPIKGQFGLNTKLSVNRAGKGNPVFLLRTQKIIRTDSMIPVIPEEPFQYISRLENAYLKKQNGQTFIVLCKEK